MITAAGAAPAGEGSASAPRARPCEPRACRYDTARVHRNVDRPSVIEAETVVELRRAEGANGQTMTEHGAGLL